MYFDMIKDECETYALGTKDEVGEAWVVAAGPYLLGAGQKSVIRFNSHAGWVDEFVSDRAVGVQKFDIVDWVYGFKVYFYKSGDPKQRTYMGKHTVAQFIR